MKAPKKDIFGHTWVGWLNLIFLRWFFIRLAWIVDIDDDAHIEYFRGWKIVFAFPWEW
jgi:hypothetical protein